MRKTVSFSTLILAGALLAGCSPEPQPAAEAPGAGRQLVYFGTYTRGESRGIYSAWFSPDAAEVAGLELAAEVPNPSFLALHPNRKYLYAVSEMLGGGKREGAVSAFSIDHVTGKLTLLNQVSARGAGPCHVAVDHTGKYVAVANYSSGSTAVFPIAEDGRLGEATGFIQHEGKSVHPKRQQGPHAHVVVFSPDNRFLLVADLGLDKVLVYRFDAGTGKIEPNDPPFAALAPGSGPRHLAFHPSKPWVYVINELSSTVTAFRYDSQRGALEEFQTVSTLPDGFEGENTTAEIAVHPSGKFLYGSNRGHDSIAVFQIDQEKGTLSGLATFPTRGEWPRNFALDPKGKFLFAANQRSDSVSIYSVDPATGHLEALGQPLPVPTPVCVLFVP